MLELVAFIMHADGPTHLRALKNQDRWAFRYDLKKKTTKYVHLKEYETDPKFDDRFFVNMSCEFETACNFCKSKQTQFQV